MQIRHDVDLSTCSTFGLAGRARTLYLPENEADLLTLAPLIAEGAAVIGGGSNLAFAEEIARPLIRLCGNFRTCEEPPPLSDLPQTERKEGEEVLLYSGAGVALMRLVIHSAAAGLTGLERLAGIPGTLGGAVYMNAGANGGCLADVFALARIFDAQAGTFRDLLPKEAAFAYRSSALQRHRWFVTGATLRLRTAAPGRDLLQEVTEYIERRSSWKIKAPNCGSVFLNPPDAPPAGQLLEQAGMKGFALERMRVSPVHANFFENLGGATLSDFLRLRDLAVDRVRQRCGIGLVSEVRIVT